MPFGLALFDDRTAIDVRDPETRALRALVDTDSPAVREWAEAVYEAYRRESAPLESFTKKGLREALEAAGE